MLERLIDWLKAVLMALLGEARPPEPGRDQDDAASRPRWREPRDLPAIMEIAEGGGAQWGTLSALAAHPTDADRLYAVTDQDSPPVRIMEISISNGAPRVVRQVEVNAPGFSSLDCEGLAIKPQGGYWLASEGGEGNAPPNVLLEVGGDGRLLGSIDLPPSIAARVGDHGFEGVAYVSGKSGGARLAVSFQAGLEGDPEGVTRVGIVDLQSRTWTFHFYPLEQLESGKYSGLSDIMHLGGNRFAFIERDGKGGKKSLKWVTVADLGGEPGASADGRPPLVKKRLAMDLVPLFRDADYKVEKEIEGLAIAADGRVYAITDNDNERATLLLYLGRAENVFGG